MTANDVPQTEKEAEKARIRKRYKGGSMENAEHIPAKEAPKIFDSDNDMKVAVYARVSTMNKQQTSSYELQKEHYADFVSRQDGWELVGIYADEGISGTSLNHREEFKRMIADCKKGGIDLIVVKSVSRFTRNVGDGRASIDMLAELKPPVGIWFENERIYSLSSDSEFLLNLTMSVAAEESRVKSVSQVSSLKMRLSHNILLTPPLLGYDNDEEGNLILNESEAKIVKLIFCMYLRGYGTTAIAEKLTALGLSTKAGNKIWPQGSVLGILQNERHCGKVRTWKTFTPDYKSHKSRKNRGEREQYIYHNHHAPIVSPDDFNAVQKMITNAKYGGRGFMPELKVICGGALHSYVSISPRWAAFTADDYRSASESAVYDEPVKESPSPIIARIGDIDLRGYEIVRAQFFNAAFIRSVTFSAAGIRFSSECIRKLGDAEYVEIFVQPAKKLLAAVPCGKENKRAVRWAVFTDGKFCSRDIGGAAFIGTLFELFGWQPERKYRFRGSVRSIGDEQIMEFDLNEPEIIMPDMVLYQNDRRADFGNDYYRHAQTVHALAGNTVIKAGQTDYNAEPDIHPTGHDVLDGHISKLISEMRSAEENDGREPGNEV